MHYLLKEMNGSQDLDQDIGTHFCNLSMMNRYQLSIDDLQDDEDGNIVNRTSSDLGNLLALEEQE